MSLEKEFLAILKSRSGERAAHDFLKRNRLLIQMAFARAWNANFCVPEFRLGSEFRTDFLLLSADSGLWYAAFIELKSPASRLYNKDGTALKHCEWLVSNLRIAATGSKSTKSICDRHFRRYCMKRMSQRNAHRLTDIRGAIRRY